MPSLLTNSLRKPGALDPANMDQITDPAEIQRLLTAGSRIRSSRHMAEALHLTQNALYRTVAGHLLVGSTEPDLHDHERWHFLKLSSRKADWWLLRGDAQWHHIMGEDFYGSLSRAHDEIALHLAQYQRGGLTYESARLSLALLGRYGGLEEITTALIASHTTGLDAVERHELLYHYEAWLARHPEAADMPRDLVRRMHGLGAMVEVSDLLLSKLDAQSIWDSRYVSGRSA